MTIARITTKGQVTIPAQVRKNLGLEEGDALIFDVTSKDEARIRVVKRKRLTDLYGILPATHAYTGKEAARAAVGQHLGQKLAPKRDTD